MATLPSSTWYKASAMFFMASLWVKRIIVVDFFNLQNRTSQTLRRNFTNWKGLKSTYCNNGGMISFSLSASKAAVGSSNNKKRGFLTKARAKAIRARCPPDNMHPADPTSVWYCLGNCMMKSWALAAFAAASISSWEAPLCQENKEIKKSVVCQQFRSLKQNITYLSIFDVISNCASHQCCSRLLYYPKHTEDVWSDVSVLRLWTGDKLIAVEDAAVARVVQTAQHGAQGTLTRARLTHKTCDGISFDAHTDLVNDCDVISRLVVERHVVQLDGDGRAGMSLRGRGRRGGDLLRYWCQQLLSSMATIDDIEDTSSGIQRLHIVGVEGGQAREAETYKGGLWTPKELAEYV